MLKFEHRKQPLASRSVFLKRMFKFVVVSFTIFIITNSIGTSIFHYVGNFTWVDSMLNAVSIMVGVGIITDVTGHALKIVLPFYEICSVITFYLITIVIFAPLAHRFLHKFHLDVEEDRKSVV